MLASLNEEFADSPACGGRVPAGGMYVWLTLAEHATPAPRGRWCRRPSNTVSCMCQVTSATWQSRGVCRETRSASAMRFHRRLKSRKEFVN